MGLPRASHPTYTMVLPSTGKPIKFRPFLVKEEKILLMASEGNDESAMAEATKTVLRNCVMEDGFDVDQMTLFDFQFAFMQLRARSVGEIADLNCVCAECKQPNEYKLNFMEMKVDVPTDVDFKVKLNKELGVVMRWPRVDLLTKFAKKDLTDPNHASEVIMACIEKVWDDAGVYDPHEETLEEQMAFLDSLSREEIKKLEAFTNTIPTLDHKIEFNCAHCGVHNHRSIGGLSDFF